MAFNVPRENLFGTLSARSNRMVKKLKSDLRKDNFDQNFK